MSHWDRLHKSLQDKIIIESQILELKEDMLEYQSEYVSRMSEYINEFDPYRCCWLLHMLKGVEEHIQGCKDEIAELRREFVFLT